LRFIILFPLRIE
jgi:hypothetical protein